MFNKKEIQQNNKIKKYKLKNLFIGELCFKTQDNIYIKSLVAVKKIKNNESKLKYQEIFTGTEYNGYTTYNNKGLFVYNETPILELTDNMRFKKILLNQGYITEEQILTILNSKNTGIDLYITKDNKFRLNTKNISKPSNSKKEYIKEKDFDKESLNYYKSVKKKENNKYDFYILTEKEFNNMPAIGREKEIEEVILSLAQERKTPILVGESGVGKTAIMDQLAYLIQKDKVPKFLKNKEIIEINISEIMAGTEYRGALENKINKIIDYAIKNNVICLINEIHNIYGAGSTKGDDNDIAGILKVAIDRKGLKVVGTTTNEEYNKYFSKDALKRRFDKIEVKEPDNNVLNIIGKNIINEFSKNNNIGLNNFNENEISEIVHILINLTNKKHRNFYDKVNNPDLLISIIDKAFASSKVNEDINLTINNIISAINTCARIYDSAKEEAISNLKNLKPKEKNKIIKFV